MTDFPPGQRVEADASGTLSVLGQGSIFKGTVVGPGDAPGSIRVKIDTEVMDSGERYSVFDLQPDRLRAI